MKLAVCDDDSLSLSHFCKTCSLSGDNELVPFSSGAGFLTQIRSGETYDSVFMDIDLKDEKNGIFYGTELFKLAPQIRVVFVTGFAERYVQPAFLNRINLVGFLIKPVEKEFLQAMLKKISDLIDYEKQTLFCPIGKGDSVTLPVKDILFLESDAHKTHIYTTSEEYVVYERLSSLSEKLPSSFLSCHKSFLVNMEKIRRIEKNRILFNPPVDVEVPISKAHYSSAREAYFQYIQNMI